MMISEWAPVKEHAKTWIIKAERRLYAYNDLVAKDKNDRLDLAEMRRAGVVEGGSKDIIFQRASGGARVSPQELWQIRVEAMTTRIKETTRELCRLREAMKSVRDDAYGEIIPLKYMEGKTDEAIAEILNCDVSTARRNRKRLLRKIAVRLYGAEAMEL
ncbi:hypothetical protein FACS189492_2220 [Clostridia bacterium]|nr:hypothetical protein FACS189492_2220 [Clostridia bacterium]